MPQGQAAQSVVHALRGAASSSKESPRGRKEDLVRRFTNIRLNFSDGGSRRPPARIVNLKDGEVFDLDTLESDPAQLQVDLSQGAAVLRTISFREGIFHELLAGQWTQICRAGRFLDRTIHRGRYRDAISEDEIARFEDAGFGELTRHLEAMRARAREVAELLAEFGVRPEDIVGVSVKTFSAHICNPFQAMAFDLCQEADTLTSMLRVLDTFYYRRGLTRSASGAATREETTSIRHHVYGAIRAVIEPQDRLHSHLESIVRKQREQLAADEERRKNRAEAKHKAEAERKQQEAERRESAREKGEAVWSGVEARMQAERRKHRADARRQAREAAEEARRKAAESFGPIPAANGSGKTRSGSEAPVDDTVQPEATPPGGSH